jgi:transposase, IS5 family
MNSLGKQRTLAMMTGFERYTKKTRRAMFLEEMEQVVPWAKVCALIEPHYPKPGKGRRPKELEQMLRIYFLQQWFNLADPAVEEALYDSATLRQFANIDLGAEPVPDETTVCKFRHLLEEHNLGEEILGTVNQHLQAKGIRITSGTIVDATIIHAPSSTKNRDQGRDPEMHQTRKGKQWYFGMKAHVGVDSKTKIIHTAVATAANVSDVAILPDLLHGEETRVWGDGAYQGQSEVIRACAARAQDYTQRRCRYKGQIVDEVAWAKNRTKSKVRAKVEHVFQVMKLKFGFVKVRYRGLKKNAHRLFVTCALVNLFMSRRKLLRARAA